MIILLLMVLRGYIYFRKNKILSKLLILLSTIQFNEFIYQHNVLHVKNITA